MRVWASYREPGFGWIRVVGYGLCWKDTRRIRNLFSERNGYATLLRIGHWQLKWLGR